MSVSLMRGGAAPASAADVEVTYEDQLRVNEFSRNNARLNELTQEIKARKSSLETLSDAADECELATEEGDIKLVLGESFFNIDEEFAEQHLNALMDKLKNEIAESEKELEAITARQQELKTALYATFGDHIKLDE